MRELRPHQVKAVEMLRESLRMGLHRPILAAPCSFGKTTVASYLFQSALEKGKRPMFIVDRVELIDQASARFDEDGIDHGIIQGDHWRTDYSKPVQIATIQTLAKRRNVHFDFAIVDECVKEGTEILTEAGFVKIEDLDKQARVAQYDQNTKEISFTVPLRHIKNEFNGKLKRFSGDKHGSISVTPNHEMLLRNTKTGEQSKRFAKDVNPSGYWRFPCAGLGSGPDGELTTHEKLMIALQADGSIHRRYKDGRCSLLFSFVKQRKIDDFLSLMNEGDWTFAEIKSYKNKRRFIVRGVDNASKMLWDTFGIDELSSEKAKQIIEYMVKWDGSRVSDKNYYYSSVVKENTEFYQCVATLAGYKSKIFVQVDDRKETYRDVHRLSILKRDYFGGDRYKVNNEDYRGYVYCVTVPKGNIILRGEGGHPVITGNCHTLYDGHKKYLEQYSAVPFIGLSATPFTKGLGKYFNNLLVPATTSQLMAEGYLCEYECYAPSEPDLKAVRVKRGDYDQAELAQAADKPKLVGDIVKHHQKLAKGRPTVVFAVDIKHSKHICQEFQQIGVKAVHVDAYTDKDTRAMINEQFKAGLIDVLSCVAIFEKGWDAPIASCLIDAAPTKSIMRYVQRIGRILRTHESKSMSIILDHAGNTERHGWVEDIVPTHLDYGEKQETFTKERNKKKQEPSKCPKCSYVKETFICGKCGFKPESVRNVETISGELEKKSKKKKYTKDEKEAWYSMFLYYAQEKGFKSGWAYHKTVEKCGTFLRSSKNVAPTPPNEECLSYIKYLNIKRAKGYGATK